jgi:hypothetical protein
LPDAWRNNLSGWQVVLLRQHFNSTIDQLLLVPVKSFKRRSDPAFGIQNVRFDTMPVNQRFDKVDAELEVVAQGVNPSWFLTFDGRLETHAPVLSVTANAHRQVKRGIIGNRRGVDLINEALFFQKLLNPGELRDCERALQRVAAARIEKDDDRRTAVKNSLKVIRSLS